MKNEKRLIDANALEKDIRAYADNIAYYGRIEYANGVANAVGLVYAAPTVDAVEVVRCGVCQYCDTADCPMSGTKGRVSASDFCSRGERREVDK